MDLKTLHYCIPGFKISCRNFRSVGIWKTNKTRVSWMGKPVHAAAAGRRERTNEPTERHTRARVSCASGRTNASERRKSCYSRRYRLQARRRHAGAVATRAEKQKAQLWQAPEQALVEETQDDERCRDGGDVRRPREGGNEGWTRDREQAGAGDSGETDPRGEPRGDDGGEAVHEGDASRRGCVGV